MAKGSSGGDKRGNGGKQRGTKVVTGGATTSKQGRGMSKPYK